MSADGKIASVRRQASGWTSKADFDRLLALRVPADALMVGRGTLDADRMTLTVPDAARQPLRCIVTRRGVLDPEHPVFARDGGPIHVLVTGEGGVDGLPESVRVHRGHLRGFLEALGREHAVRRVHCEGGGELVRALAELDLVDEIHLTWAGHTMFGGREAPTVTGVPGDFLPASRAYELTHFEPRADDGECFLTWRRTR